MNIPFSESDRAYFNFHVDIEDDSSRAEERAYEDLLLRWLTAKRDYPELNREVPEPEMPRFCDHIRQRVIREFNRTA